MKIHTTRVKKKSRNSAVHFSVEFSHCFQWKKSEKCVKILQKWSRKMDSRISALFFLLGYVLCKSELYKKCKLVEPVIFDSILAGEFWHICQNIFVYNVKVFTKFSVFIWITWFFTLAHNNFRAIGKINICNIYLLWNSNPQQYGCS